MTSLAFLSAFIIAANAASVERRLGGRIIGGSDASIEDYPYQVSVQTATSHYCGGSIISNRHVLTAAHCVHFAPSDLYVRSGTSYSVKSGVLHSVVKSVKHNNWRSGADVAVLTVDPPFVFGDTRMPIRLATKRPASGAVANITGWGKLNPEHVVAAKRLQTVQVPVIANDVCIKAYKNTSTLNIEKSELCAGYLGVGGKDSCQGDSGGPLVIDNEQVGVISFGKGCADPRYPGVYADVAFFRKWIEEQAHLNL